jgi:type IV secretory pathway VirB9-like protein
MKIIKLWAALVIVAANVSAIAAPVACSYDLKSSVTDVLLRPSQVVDICLPTGEKIADIAAGSSYGWAVEVNKETGRIMVKISDPAAAQDTNMIVWSDKNTRYELKLARSRSTDVQAAKNK